MSVLFNFNKMAKLIDNFYEVTKVRCSMVDINSNLLCQSSKALLTQFCKKLRSCHMKNGEIGDDLCVKCDAKHVKYVSSTKLKYYTYRCHAGLLETIIPIVVADETIAYIYLGQYLNEDDLELQWKNAKELLEENFDDVERFKEEFMNIKVLSDEVLVSSVELLVACMNYISAECLIKNTPISQYSQIYEYISENYDSELSLDKISYDLSIGKTTLCNIAKSHNTTINAMIKNKRLDKAKELLENTTLSITEVATKVGVDNFAYFTKMFKDEFKMSPSEYRKKCN